MGFRHTWSVNDGQVGAVFVLDLDHNLLRPELLLSLQAPILIFNVVLDCIKILSRCMHGPLNLSGLQGQASGS